jgi:hypothetical protein
MRSFRQFLEDLGFQSEACEALIETDFYRLAESMHEALETIADPSTSCMTHAETVGALRCHARRAINP